MTISRSTLMSLWRMESSGALSAAIPICFVMHLFHLLTSPLVMWLEQTDWGEPHRPTWCEDRGRLRSPSDPGRGGRQHKPAGSTERNEACGRLVPWNPSSRVWRNHHHQSVPSTRVAWSPYSSSTALCNGCVSQLTMCWWSPGTVCCWCLTSGRRRRSREPAVTSPCTWTSHAGTTGCWRRWRRWSKIKVGGDTLHFLSLHRFQEEFPKIDYFRIQWILQCDFSYRGSCMLIRLEDIFSPFMSRCNSCILYFRCELVPVFYVL